MLTTTTFTTTAHSKQRLAERFDLAATQQLTTKALYVEKFAHNYHNALCVLHFAYINNQPALLISYAATKQLITVYTTPTKKSQQKFWNHKMKIVLAKLKAAATTATV
jgi:hypothetical protein